MTTHARTNAQIVIERARPSQASRLTQVAQAAKSFWGYPAHWIELWHNQLHISSAFIEQNDVYVAMLDGVVLGFYALSGAVPKLTLEHMWVMPVAIRQGLGRALFDHAVQRAQELAARVIEIEADPNAVGFYERMGAETVGEVSYVLDGIRRSLPFMEFHLPVGTPA